MGCVLTIMIERWMPPKKITGPHSASHCGGLAAGSEGDFALEFFIDDIIGHVFIRLDIQLQPGDEGALDRKSVV